MKNSKVHFFLIIIGLFLSGLVLSTSVEAATVLKCHQKKRHCTIRLNDGYVGTKVEVLDEKAHVVAYGWIIKRRGAYGVIAFKKILQPIRRGYPVIVKIDDDKDSNLQWAASFSDKD